MDESLVQSDSCPTPPSGSSKSIRVGWIAGRRADGPLVRLYQPLVIGLMDEMVEVVLFHPAGAGAQLGAGLSEIFTFPTPGVLGLRKSTVREMAEKVSGAKIQLLHALDASVIRLARKVSKAACMKFVCSSHGVRDAAHMRRLSRRTAALLAASTPIHKALAERGVIDADKLSTVRPGVYCVRQPTCFDGSDRSIAIVAGGEERRDGGFETILKAFAELIERKLNCVFFMICAGQTRRNIRRTADRLNLLDSLTFVDPRLDSQFTGIIKAADVYVSAGPGAHLDAHVLLAMAAGSAVICPPDESADFAIDGQTALLYRSGSSAELTIKLVSLLDDQEAARSLARGALAHISEYHSAAAAVAETAAIYRKALAR